jgi:hypothetical protein
MPLATNRRLLLIDVENLIGADHHGAGPDVIRPVLSGWLRRVGWQPGELLVIACNPALGLAVRSCLPAGQLLVRHGKNGADGALLDWASPEFIAGRFDQVVIGSGDQAFAPLVKVLTHLGVRVRVICRRGSAARALTLAVETPLRPRKTAADVDARGPK